MKSTVETKIIELVKSGHELAKELHCAESAALVSDLASQLEVQFARSNALAAKLSMINDLMGAAEQANKLAQEATEKLVQERDALAAENAALTNINAWCHTEAFGNMYREFKTAEALGCSGVDCMHDAMLAALMHAPETPATDAFLAEVRNEAGARAVELFAQTLGSPYSVRDEKCYEDGFTRAIEVVRDIQAPRFAYKIRQAGM